MTHTFDPSSLKEYMDSKPIRVINPEVVYPIQGDLFEVINGDYHPRRDNSLIGNFYEILTYAIFGGEWRGTKNTYENRDDEWYFNPDVVTSGAILDAKAVSWSESCKFTDFQMRKYLVQQTDAVFMESNKVGFPIYKYKIRKPWSHFDKTKRRSDLLEEIVMTLSTETGFMLFLPFSVAYQIWNPNFVSPDFESRYDGDRYDHLSRFLAKGIKKMLTKLEEVFRAFQLPWEEYIITKTSLPKGVKMNNSEIKPFPILLIQDRDYNSQLKRFREETKELVEAIKREKKTRDQSRERNRRDNDVSF